MSTAVPNAALDENRAAPSIPWCSVSPALVSVAPTPPRPTSGTIWLAKSIWNAVASRNAPRMGRVRTPNSRFRLRSASSSIEPPLLDTTSSTRRR
jgi:hypothetical protein